MGEKYNGYGVDSKRHIGFIAQELLELFPDVVHEGQFLSVDYFGMIGVAIEGLKELYEKCVNCDMEIADQIEELKQWGEKISAAEILYAEKRERLQKEQDLLYEKSHALLNATKALQNEVMVLVDDADTDMQEEDEEE